MFFIIRFISFPLFSLFIFISFHYSFPLIFIICFLIICIIFIILSCFPRRSRGGGGGGRGGLASFWCLFIVVVPWSALESHSTSHPINKLASSSKRVFKFVNPASYWPKINWQLLHRDKRNWLSETLISTLKIEGNSVNSLSLPAAPRAS